MAIVRNFWLKNLKKTLADAVIYQQGGETRMRTKAASIANPRTRSQMAIRVRMANVVAMYKANKRWMAKYAFENKPSRWSVFNAFSSANLGNNNCWLTKQDVANGYCIVAPYKMTDGTLPQITYEDSDQGTNQIHTNLNLGDTAIPSFGGLTIGELSGLLISNNNGIENGMQLSIIENYQQQSNDTYSVFARYYEMIIDTADTRLLSTILPVANLSGDSAVLTYEADGAAAVCFVLSHTTSGHTSVSPSYMCLTDVGQDFYDLFSTESYHDIALTSYGETDEPFLESSYQESSNSNVAVYPSLLSIGYNGATFAAGDYVGNLSASPQITINLSAEPDANVSVTIQLLNGQSKSVSNVIPGGTSFNVSFTSVDTSSPLSHVAVNVGHNITRTITFATSNEIVE